MKVFLTGLAVIAALAGVTACEGTRTHVTDKKGAVNEALCSGDTPFIMFTKTGDAGEMVVCVTQATYDKYKIGDVYSG